MDGGLTVVVPGIDLGPMDQKQANAAEARCQQPAGLARRGAHRQLQGRVARGGGGAVDVWGLSWPGLGWPSLPLWGLLRLLLLSGSLHVVFPNFLTAA